MEKIALKIGRSAEGGSLDDRDPMLGSSSCGNGDGDSTPVCPCSCDGGLSCRSYPDRPKPLSGRMCSSLSTLSAKLEMEDNQWISSNNFDDSFLEKYAIITKINTGSSGFVVCAKSRRPIISRRSLHIPQGEIVAIKIMYKCRIPFQNWTMDAILGLVPLELSILSQIDHEVIARMLDFHEDKNFFYLILEYGGRGTPDRSDPGYYKPVDLYEFMNYVKLPLSEPEIRSIFSQIISAVLYLHSNAIVHGDIKNENIAIEVETKKVKLIDFGCAVRLRYSRSRVIDSFLGTINYAAPETNYDRPYLCGPHIDSWSLGVLLFRMAFNVDPFDSPADRESDIWLHTIARAPVRRSQGLVSLISQMLQVSPLSRPTLSQIASHPWLSPQLYTQVATHHLIPHQNDAVPMQPHGSPQEISLISAT